MMDMDGMMGGGMALFLVVVVAIVIGSVFVARALWNRSGRASSQESPGLDILKERYARGEIDRDEFEERRRVL